MAQVGQRMRTQTEAFWKDEWEVSAEDLEYLYSSFLEEETPRSLDDLARRLVSRRCQLEVEQLTREAEQGPIYRPRDTHEIGQKLIFPALDRQVGEVTAIRPGENREYGPFQVIAVRFQDHNQIREFASSFEQPHRLNDMPDMLPMAEEDRLSEEQICDLYGETIRAKLQEALESDPEFVHIEAGWFLRSLLPEINVGQLNLAEAVIDMAQRPLSTDDILRELDLGTRMGPDVQRAALETALHADERFDQVGASGRARWFLYSLEPEAVVEVPLALRPAYVRPHRPLLLAQLAQSVQEIGDELDEDPRLEAPDRPVDSVSFMLNYPHWREGTVPVTRAMRQLLPSDSGSRYPISFLDGANRIPGWVSLDRLYIWGLRDWYQRQDLPVGATVTLTRMSDPRVLAVGYEKRPRRGEWVREARVAEGRLTFEMQRRAYTCRYDRYLLFHVTDQERLSELAAEMAKSNRPLADLMLSLVPELIKLSSQGVFQAQTLYAAVNLVRRSGALPIYAELTRRACFDPVGGGNWAFDPSLKDLVYATEEDMHERPNSEHEGLMRDAVMVFEA